MFKYLLSVPTTSLTTNSLTTTSLTTASLTTTSLTTLNIGESRRNFFELKSLLFYLLHQGKIKNYCQPINFNANKFSKEK